ncbi:unnamed protein product [Sphagnum balticum]
MALLESGSIEDRQKVIKQIGDACEEWGFFQVLNHGMPLDLLDKGFANSHEFFNLPLEEKLKCKHPKGSVPIPAGFMNDMISKGVPDAKEMMFIYSETSFGARFNLWPEKPANFRLDVGSEIVNAATKTGLHMLGLVSESLGLPNEHLPALANAKPRSDMFYFLYYPATPDNPNAVGSTKHTDGNILTILAIDNQMPGLQIWRGEKWLPVTPVKGAIIINVGDVLQVWSNDKYKSVTHRVVNSPTKPRFSIPLLLGPGHDFVIEPLVEFINEDHPPAFKPFVYKDYLLARFKNKNNTSKDAPEISIDYCRV